MKKIILAILLALPMTIFAQKIGHVKSGDIVQGMSGSPIVQNGRLVGAVTHVLVNDPTRGYAVFAENMLEAQQQSAQLSAQTAA